MLCMNSGRNIRCLCTYKTISVWIDAYDMMRFINLLYSDTPDGNDGIDVVRDSYCDHNLVADDGL